MTQKLLTRAASGGLFGLLSLTLGMLLLHCLTNGEYGFHRDELAVLDDARRLAWGYVGYPPACASNWRHTSVKPRIQCTEVIFFLVSSDFQPFP